MLRLQFHMEIWTVFPTSSLYFCSLFRSRRIALVDFLGALDDKEFFVVEGSGGGGVAGSQSLR